MLKHFIKTSWQNLKAKKVFTLLNVLGLAVGIASCWIIYRTVSFEHNYEAFLAPDANIHQVVSDFGTERETKMGSVAAPLYQAADKIPGIINIVPVYNQWITSIEILREKDVFVKQEPEAVVATKPAYFTMLPYIWLAGNQTAALNDIAGVVLTKTRADFYFPNTAPERMLNKTITYFGRDTVVRKVTGIVADLPKPTQFTGAEFIVLKDQAYPLNEWTNTNGNNHLYLQLNQTSKAETIAQALNKIDMEGWHQFTYGKENPVKRGRNYVLYPVKDLHFATEVSDYYAPARTSKKVLQSLLGIALFLLLIACINYINMNVAQIPQRGKEVGIRKTLGGTKSQLMYQFLCETVITILFASVISIVLIGLGFSILQDVLPAGLTMHAGIKDVLLFICGLTLLITLFAGLYPAWLITRIKTVEIFKNFGLKNHKRFSLQKVLIIFQFVIALVFITSTIIVSSQMKFVLHSDLGFNKDAVVLADIPWQYARTPAYKGRENILLNHVKNIPGVEAVLGSAPLSTAYSSSPFESKSSKGELIKTQVFKKSIDPGYLDFYNLQLLAGRSIIASDSLSGIMLNETAVKNLGFISAEEAVGKSVNQLGNPSVRVVGVVKDFHTRDFYTPIEPLALSNNGEGLISLNLRLKTHATGWQQTLKKIENEWYQLYPADTFKFKFYDETLEAIYKQERRTATLISIAAAIMIFVSCLGLFGLATLMAWQRTKEIGIRKVLGARIPGIISLFLKEYVRLIIVAIVIAMPVAWWAMNRWLTDFTYKIELQWWMFAAAGLGVILLAVITVSSRILKVVLTNPVKSLRSE